MTFCSRFFFSDWPLNHNGGGNVKLVYNIFSNNQLISNRFVVFVTCTHIFTYLWNRLLIDFYLCVYDRVCKVPHVLFNICVCERKLIFLCRGLSFIFYWFGMVRRKLTIPERWQAVGMHNGGLSHRRVADHFRVNHSIIVRLMQRFRQTENVTDRPRAGRPRKTTAERGPAHIQTGAATAVQYSWCTSW
jgi:hypothetical protein